MSVREAAERLRRYLKNRIVVASNYAEITHDIQYVVNRYFADHPADEQTEISYAWLRSIGFVEYTDLSDALYLPAEVFKPVVGLTHNGRWLINGTLIETKIETRGQLRKLMEALGVETKENKGEQNASSD